MRKNLSYFLILLVGAAVFWMTACHRQDHAATPELSDSLAKLRPLHQIILKYAEESRATGRRPIFPATLDSLVASKVLSPTDLAKSTDLPHFRYRPPTDSPKDDYAIFQWEIDQQQWVFCLDGTAQGIDIQ